MTIKLKLTLHLWGDFSKTRPGQPKNAAHLPEMLLFDCKWAAESVHCFISPNSTDIDNSSEIQL